MPMKNIFTLTKMKRMDNGKRDAKNGFIWFYYVWDSEGKRRKNSTGQTTKVAAQAYCCKLIREGKLIPMKHNRDYFRTLVQDFYDPEKSTYLKGKEAQGKKNAKSSLNSASRALKNHILPFFGDMLVSSITQREIEEWVANLKGKGLSNGSIKLFLVFLKQIFRHLKASGVISSEPTENFGLSGSGKKERGILTDDEVKDLMNEASIESYWQGDRKMYLANLISCLTGMRVGEILALKEENIKEDYIDVVHSFNSYDGLKKPKNGKPRKVPIPRGLYGMLREFFPEDNGFIFLDKGKHDYEGKLRKPLYVALSIMGIDRKGRNIVFHSWRHWFNSKLVKAKIIPSKIKTVIGHTEKGQDMTDLYTHFSIEDFQDIVEIQTEILESFRESEIA